MIEFKIVVKTHYRFNDSDKEFIKNFLLSTFKDSKEIQDLYMEETSE